MQKSNEEHAIFRLIYLLEEFTHSPLREALICLVTAPIVLIGSYKASIYFEHALLIYLGIACVFVLLVFPARIALALFLLWWNPQKYKERGMKELRKQWELEKRNRFGERRQND